MSSSSDAATWVGVVATFITSVAALVVAIRSNSHAKEAVVVAERAALAAERQAAAAEAAIPPTPPAVSWSVKYSGGSRYVLRNRGPRDATNIHIEPHPSVVWDDYKEGMTVAEGAAMTFYALVAAGDPDLTELRITCDEVDRVQIVAMP